MGKNIKEKKCNICLTVKPVSEFYYSNTHNCYMYACKECATAKGVKRRAEFLKNKGSRQYAVLMLAKLKRRAKLGNLPFDLTHDDITKIYTTEHCTYCDRVGQRMTFDRKVPELGYVMGNCAPACFSCNKTKSALFTYEEMLIIGKALETVYKSRVT